MNTAKRIFLVLGAGALLVSVYLSGQAVLVTRSPYLQRGSYDSLVVRWRTNVATDSRVCYGASPSTLSSCVTDPQSVTEHIVSLAGLGMNTTYYYSVGSSSGIQT